MDYSYVCDHCGTQFTRAGRARGAKVYCSVTCKGEASRVYFSCETCGKRVYGYQNINKRFCSKPCSGASRKEGEERVCPCGKSFYARRSQIAKGQGLFCSHACHTEYQGRNKVPFTCETCGAQFRVSPSVAVQRDPRYCSLLCSQNAAGAALRRVRANATRQRLHPTNLEVAGYAILDSLGLDYLRQEIFANQFAPDAMIPHAQLIIEFDGEYWHDRSGVSQEQRIRQRVARDRTQDALASDLGWRTLRFWESDVLGSPEDVAATILRALGQPS